MNCRIHNFLYLFLLFLSSIAFGKNNLVGNPFIKNYTPKEYKASNQNWAIVQDNRGIMYFGNSDGILEYDGANWRLIKTLENAVVRSLAKNETGKIYVGTYGDFGYLAPDSTGSLQYVSLRHIIPEAFRDFADIWNIHIIQDKVYFKSYKYLFVLQNGKLKIIVPSQSEFNDSFVYRDTLYIEYWQIGLGQLIQDSVHLILTGENFSGEYPGVSSFLPYENVVLIANPNTGIFLFDGKSIKKFENDVEDYLIKNQLYLATSLDKSEYLFTTTNGGLAIMDKNGLFKGIINKESGLLNNTIWQIYIDNQNSIWLATDNGISHIEYPSPYTNFYKHDDVLGTITQILRFNKTLYIGANNGLFYLDEKLGTNYSTNEFKRVSKLNEVTWNITPFEDELIVGANNGTFIVKNNFAKQIRAGNSVFVVKSRVFTNRIYIGLIDGLVSMHYKDGRWIDDGRISGISEYISNRIAETKNGDLWLGHYKGIIHVDFPDKFTVNPKVTKYDKSNGLPANKNNYIYETKNKVYFTTSKGLYSYHQDLNRILPDSTYGSEFCDGSRGVFLIREDDQKNIWMYSNNEVLKLKLIKDGRYVSDNTPFLRFAEFSINYIYPDINGKAWFGGADGLFMYDQKIKKNYINQNKTVLRKISTLNDSLIFGGIANKNLSNIVRLPFKLNSLNFEFSLPFFDNENANQFKYMIDGFDDSWSTWNKANTAVYKNIPEGRYVFKVLGKNIYNLESIAESYSFIILPPWYRSTWAYLIFGLIIIGMVSGLVKLRSVKLEQEKKELEKIINERTDEIQVKNKQLEEQAEKLQEMDEIKSRFFANISHELRTPLTLIKGPTEELVNKTYPGDENKALNSILTNTNRVLKLINELLDLSKLESGSMKLKASLQKLTPFINYIVKSFLSFAESRNIHLQFLIPEEEIELYYDREKLEKVIYNLLSNAFKFTQENGYITVAVNKIIKSKYPLGAVEISVHDSGMGIPENDVEQIFNRFIQAHNSGNSRLEGSGIGLALSKELVELHKGQITVSSFVDEGTEFDVILPLGKEHLKPEEIVGKEILGEEQNISIQFNISDFESDIKIETVNKEKKSSGEKCLVLIIEDHGEVRDYIKEHLKNNYEIIVAENGKIGLDLAYNQLPDLILSDVMMPEMDGFELAETIKKNELTNHIPIILLTAKASDEAKIEGLETGADAYMSKPFNAKELEVRIKKLIESRINLREKFKKEFILEPTENKTISMDDDFIRRVHDSIEEKMYDSEFNVEVLLKDFALGQRQFTRKVIALTGQTPVQFIRIMRLKKAMNLIKNKAGTISQIAFDVGFSNLSYFSKSFQQQFGKLPSEV